MKNERAIYVNIIELSGMLGESVRCRKSATVIWIAFAVVARVLCCEIDCTTYTGRIEREKRREKETDNKRQVM